MESQLFDQFMEDRWSAEPCDSKPINTGSDLFPNYAWLNQYIPQAFNFEDLPSLDELESCSLSNTSSPLEFSLPSPISDASSPFEQKPFIEPWVLPTAFENNPNTLFAPCNSPSTSSENFLAISTPRSPSSSFPDSSTSECNSPRDVEIKTEKPTISLRTGKNHRASTSTSTSRSKSPICKRQNAHNLIEKRYRNNLNSKINALRDCIPAFRSTATKGSEDGDEDVDSDAGERRKGAQKCNKGIVLGKAIQYIAELEKEVQRLSEKNAELQLRVKNSIPNYLMLGLRC